MTEAELEVKSGEGGAYACTTARYNRAGAARLVLVDGDACSGAGTKKRMGGGGANFVIR